MSSSFQKECKYGCEMVVVWKGKTPTPGSTGFVEVITGKEHTYNRCKQLKEGKTGKGSWTKEVEQQQQRPQYSKEELGRTFTPPNIPKTTQGGSYLDTKRIRVMLEDLTKKVDDIQHKLEYNTQIDTNKLIGQLQQVHDVIAPFLNTQGVVAADLLKDSKQLKIDPSTVNHAKKADEYIEREQQQNNTKFVDESKEHDFNIEDRIPDNHDEMLAAINDDNNNEGVINDE